MRTVPVPPPGADKTALDRLMRALDGDAGGARYIGGWVRDILRGEAPQDIDVATRLPPEEAGQRAQDAGLQVWTTRSGITHGTIGVVIDGRTIEVTTLRRDVTTDGRHATVSFTDDWREDAARRDFTINALSADPVSGEVHDYFNGHDDLAAGHVRFIGDAATRIAEDHLRILRFFRFHARFGQGDPDADGYAACVARAKDLMALSRERIATEFLKLLAVPDPGPTVGAMLDGGILQPVLPEIERGALVALRELVEGEVTAGIEPDGFRRLAALLPPDSLLAEKIGARLKLSKAARKRLTLAAGRMSAPPRALTYTIGAEAAIDALLLRGDSREVKALIGWQAPRLPISGGDLINRGLTSGPVVAATLRKIERLWLEQDFPIGDQFAAIVDQALRDAQ